MIMIPITDQIRLDQPIAWDIQYNADKATETVWSKSDATKIELAEVFVSAYPYFYQKNFPDQSVSLAINDANKYLKDSFKLPLLYQPISVSFVMDYCFWHDCADIIRTKKSVCLIRSGINVCEALMYYFTQINRMLDVDYYIYPLFTDQKPSEQTFHRYANLLQSKFEGERITYRNTLAEQSINNKSVCEKLAIEWGSDKFDLIVFEKRFLYESDTYLSHDYEMASIYLALCTLQKGGTFIFRLLMTHTIAYMQQLISLLSHFFQNIWAVPTVIRANMIRIVCDGFVGNVDKQFLSDLLNIIGQMNQSTLPVRQILSPDSLIGTDLLNPLYAHINSYHDRMINIHTKYLTNIQLLTAADLIKIYELNKNTTVHQTVDLAKKYELKLSDWFVQMSKSIPSRLSRLEVFEAPIKIDLVNMGTNNINNEITYGKLDLDLTNLLRVREKLNLYKIGIDSRDSVKWDKITRQLNMTQGIIDLIKKNQHIDISRGFVKMYEIIHTYDLIRSADQTFRSLHICEAPGHFINATQYYVKKFYPELLHEWSASSLNPSHSSNPHAFGDNYGFIRNYPSNWHWGPDNSGDLTKTSTIDYFRQTFDSNIDLVTSDCGFGAATRYEYHEQESIMGKVNLAQVIVAICCLRLGGNAVFKMYIPFSTPISVSIVYVLMGFFTDVSVFKPITGSPTNNEIYLVCLSKKQNLTSKSYQNLLSAITNFDNKMYLSPYIDRLFVDQLAWISELVTKVQIDNLKVIYYVYDGGLPDRKKLDRIREQYYLKWIRYFDAANIEQKYLLAYRK